MVGLVNGLITLRGFNPIIVTIGTLSVLSGLAAVVAGGYTFPGSPSSSSWAPTATSFGDAGELLRRPGAGLHRRRSVRHRHGLPDPHPRRPPPDGRRRQRRGGTPLRHPQRPLPGARLRDLGLLAALGGLVTTAVVTEANPSASPAIIFSALTAVALAGVALTGGRGSLPRILVGALILATISNGLTIRGIQPYWATVATGALLLGSLLFERVIQTSVSNRLMATANMSVHAKKG